MKRIMLTVAVTALTALAVAACSSAPAVSPVGTGETPVTPVSELTGDDLTGPTTITDIETSQTSLEIPALPVISVTHEGTEYPGAEGSYCWPVEIDGDSIVGLCADKIRWDGITTAIEVDPNDSIILNIDAHEFFSELTFSIFTKDVDEPPVLIHRVRGFGDRIMLGLRPGSYYATAFGFWEAGDISYEFEFTVRDTGEPVTQVPSDPFEIDNHSLLKLDDVEAASDGEVASVIARDFLAAASASPSSQVDDIVAWIAVQFDDEDAARQVQYSEIHFVSAEAASDWMDTVEAEFPVGTAPLEYGDRSAGIDALGEGAGAAIAFTIGPRGFMLLSTMQPGDDPLVDYAGLQVLVGLVEERAN